jgi:hypothetical protein
MSEVKVNKISPRTACGTVTLGDSGDTFTIPSGATITNAGTASGFGATGETSWDTTVKTTGTFTATAGVGYFLNTTGGIITVNLPVGAAGSSVAMADYAATWQTNNVTVSPNGSEKIGGVNADVTLSTEGQSVTFVYIDGTQGWVNVIDSTSNVRGARYVTATGGTPCSGAIVCTNYKVHTFTGPGTFCVSCAGGTGSNTVDYLVIAGGGSGGGADGSGATPGQDGVGGGGAGGYRESPGTASGCYAVSPLGVSPAAALAVPVQGYPITVGGGGATPTDPAPCGNAGSNSIFSSITSAGGGYGGTRPGVPGHAGGDGGSGGGAGGGFSGGTAGGAGDTPPAPVAQGMPGGIGGSSPGSDKQAGGGGGATVAGTNAAPPTSGPGGTGATSSINATPTARAGGGGGGGSPPTPGVSGCGGAGGGGAGGVGGPEAVGVAGTANTGGGGGGGSNTGVGGQGGPGTVIIRYKFQN